MRIRKWKLSDVPRRRMCIGCGACVYVCPSYTVALRDVVGSGLRPFFKVECGDSEQHIKICPGVHAKDILAEVIEAPLMQNDPFLGFYMEHWEGWAADPVIRLMGSSGGLLTALALYCLEAGGMGGVLHSGMDQEEPWRNRTFLSRSREEILKHAGSRYSPASPCDGLKMMNAVAQPCAFIGKPADVTAVQLLRKVSPEVDRSLGVVMSFFCAGTPSTQGTIDLLRNFGIEPGKLASLRYRGNGWPGGFEAITEDGRRVFMPYEIAWSRLSHYKPLRENLDPDGFGRNADISCGDAWHIEDREGNPGVSVVVVRTELGRRILHGAEREGYVVLRPTKLEQILMGQASLVNKQREIYGRILALRLFGIPHPNFPGFALKEIWGGLPFRRRVRVFLGTVRRIVSRKLWRTLDAYSLSLFYSASIVGFRDCPPSGER